MPELTILYSTALANQRLSQHDNKDSHPCWLTLTQLSGMWEVQPADNWTWVTKQLLVPIDTGIGDTVGD